MRLLCFGKPPVTICTEVFDVLVVKAAGDMVSLGGAPVSAATRDADKIWRT